MQLRFAVNQAECLKRGIDAPKSIVNIEVTPAEIPRAIRELVAKRMDGIEVCKMDADGDRLYHRNTALQDQAGDKERPFLIEAKEPTLAGLILAVMENETELKVLTPEQKAGMKELVKLIAESYDLEALYKRVRSIRD